MPRVHVLYCGPAADLAGAPEGTFELPEGATVGALAGELAAKHPRLGAALGVRLAVNRAYVALDHRLSEGDEVAVIPPVSGG